MRAYFTTQPLYNPLSPPINSQFADALVAISEPYEAPPDKGELHQPSSSIYQASGCHVFASFLACTPLSCNDYLPPKETRLRPPQLHNSSVTRKTTA